MNLLYCVPEWLKLHFRDIRILIHNPTYVFSLEQRQVTEYNSRIDSFPENTVLVLDNADVMVPLAF